MNPFNTQHRWSSLVCAATLVVMAGCVEERVPIAPGPVYESEVADLLKAHCAKCHDGGDASAAFRVDTYLHALGCPAPDPSDAGTDAGIDVIPLVRVFQRADHKKLLTPPELARLSDWAKGDAPLHRGTVHAPGMLNPRSPHWHGRLAARDHFAPLQDPKQPDTCGRCHAGAPVTPTGIDHPAAGAPACTSCHKEPAGVLACGTCHGDGAAQAFGRRDACDLLSTAPDAHRAHLESTRLRSTPLVCRDCHDTADATLRGTHANGLVDVVFDAKLIGPQASFEPHTRQCTVRCHNQGGARARPRFDEPGPLGCGDCHGSPPKDHYAGACDRCHAEANAKGTALRATVLHLNGKVDVGDGKQGCTFCHGSGDDPMPNTPSHLLHRATSLTQPIACAECHVVPQSVTSPGHLDVGEATPADVVFGARASARGQSPTYAAGTCRNIACHGAGLPGVEERALRWDAPASEQCAGCHGLPPGGDHPQDTRCATVLCHGSEVSAGSPPAITTSGRQRHIDGILNFGP